MARESYDVVVDAFSRDGRVPREGVEILLGIEKLPIKFHKILPWRLVVDNSLSEEALKELGAVVLERIRISGAL